MTRLREKEKISSADIANRVEEAKKEWFKSVCDGFYIEEYLLRDPIMLALKPYYLYCMDEGIKTIELRKHLPNPKKWDNGVFVWCTKDSASFNKIPADKREKYRPYLGTVAAYFTSKNHYFFDRKLTGDDGPTDDKFFKSTCVTWEGLREYLGTEGIGVFYGMSVDEFSLFEKPLSLSRFRKPCICPQMPYCPACKEGFEYMDEDEAEFYRLGESANTHWVCTRYLSNPPQSYYFVQGELYED